MLLIVFCIGYFVGFFVHMIIVIRRNEKNINNKQNKNETQEQKEKTGC